MNKLLVVKYAYFLVCIFFFKIGAYSQQKINSFDLFNTSTDNYSIAKVNTNTEEKLLVLENYAPDSCFYIVELINDTIHIDTIANTPAMYIGNKKDTIWYYPAITTTSMFYAKDTLFVAFGRGFVTYIRKANHFGYNDYCYFNENDLPRLSNIIGYKDGSLIFGNQNYYGEKNYTLVAYDIKHKSLIKQIKIPTENSIFLHYYDMYNAFSSNSKYISVMNTIKPEISIYDYNLNLMDNIDFALNDDYKYTKLIVDTNISVNKDVISPLQPKITIKLLSDINILNYYSNIKQTFIDDTTLIVLTNKMNKDSCDIVKIDIKNHNKELLLTYPKYGIESPYTALNMTSNVPLFSKGLFIDYDAKIDSSEENLTYYIDIYSSSCLDFSPKTIILEDKKQNIINVNTKEYEGFIIFDDYFCKECFAANNKNKKLLLIYYSSAADKVRRLSLYNELKKIYPNSNILFNHDNNFDLKYNQLYYSL